MSMHPGKGETVSYTCNHALVLKYCESENCWLLLPSVLLPPWCTGRRSGAQWPASALQIIAAAPPGAELHQLIFPGVAAAFTHLSGEEGGSRLLVKVALTVPLLSGSTHIPKLHSKAAPWASSIPLLAARLGLSCDHSCSTYSVVRQMVAKTATWFTIGCGAWEE